MIRMSGRGEGVWENSYNDTQQGDNTAGGDYAAQRGKKIKIVIVVVVLGGLVAGGLWAAGILGTNKKKEPDVVVKKNAPPNAPKKAAPKRPVIKPAGITTAIMSTKHGLPVTQKPAKAGKGVPKKPSKKAGKGKN